MRFGFNERCLDHDPGRRHPESPDRLRAIRRELARHHTARYERPNPVDPAVLKAVHDPEYLDRVRELSAEGGGRWDPDTVVTEHTWDAVVASAGLAVWATERALEDPSDRDAPFSLGRPPGHHAVADDAMGFCFANNVAVATEHVVAERSYDCDRVALFDWDVHHGNGTQDLFYDRGDVLYASIHEWDLYPGTGEPGETGDGEGAGATVNAPLRPGSGDAEYLAVVEDLIAPLVRNHDPDLLLVSAGFDAHRHDPISRMAVSTEGYGALADRIRAVADDLDAGLAFVLEGGYALNVLADSVATVHETFAGYEPDPPDDDPDESARELIDEQRRRYGLDG
jgi:acetoin utilization deacetylase AcuC-like enzyme